MLKFVFAIGFLAVACNAVAPEIILFNTDDRADATFTATTNVGSDNQLCLPPAIKSASVCVNGGTWILYPDTNFLADTAPAAIASTGPEGPQTCQVLPDNLHKNLGSYRPAGDPLGEAECTLNLYVNTFYAADELLVKDSAPQMPYAFSSVIKTGDCEWQFYTMEDYEGFSECLGANEFFIPNFSDIFPVQPGEIKSIKKGCDKKPTQLKSKFQRH